MVGVVLHDSSPTSKPKQAAQGVNRPSPDFMPGIVAEVFLQADTTLAVLACGDAVGRGARGALY
jgi:hypothetical protein